MNHIVKFNSAGYSLFFQLLLTTAILWLTNVTCDYMHSMWRHAFSKDSTESIVIA